jgi:NADH-quinone oxidoreductase subunit J
LESVVFYFFSGVSLVTALLVVASPRPIYAVLALVGCFLSVAVLYGVLGATLLAVVQIIIYVGFIAVVFPIVIVLLDSGRTKSSREHHGVLRWAAALTGLILFGLLATAIFEDGVSRFPAEMEPVRGSLVSMTYFLLSDFAVPVLGAAVVVFSALVGAAWVARR